MDHCVLEALKMFRIVLKNVVQLCKHLSDFLTALQTL